MDLLDPLLGTELFKGFRREDLEPLAPDLRRRTYQKGAYLWHAGDPVVLVYGITSGLVKARHLEPDGSEIIVQLAVPGDTIGEYPIFQEGAVRMYDCIAVQSTDGIVIPRDNLIYVLQRNPSLTMKLAASMMRRLMRGYEALTEIALVDLETRLARKLVGLIDTLGEPADGGVRIGMKLSQSLLASTVRATRENVNRALARLSEAGVIAQADGYIVVRDEAGLAERAQRA
jgi:CRP/FNR family cyclic AMP-dependent transcriptional regulator